MSMRRTSYRIAAFASLLGAASCTDRTAPTDRVATPSLEIQVEADSLQCCDRKQATLIYRDSAGIAHESTITNTWASSDSTALWVTHAGLYSTANQVTRFTQADLIATVNGLTARRTIRIRPLVDKVVLSRPPANMLGVGGRDSVALTVTGHGVTFALPDSVVQWSSSNPAVLSVDAGGRFVAVGAGDAFVKVAALGAADSVPIRVVRPYGVVEIPGSTGAYTARFNDRGDGIAYHGSGLVAWRFGSSAVPAPSDCVYPADLNSRGEVLCQGNGKLLIWDESGTHAVVGFPETVNACFSSRFNAGHAIAYVATPTVGASCDRQNGRAGVWHPDGTTTALPTPPALPYSVEYFDDAGNVAVGVLNGRYFKPAGSDQWDGFSQDLPDASYYPSYITIDAINALGYMVGSFSSRWAADVGIIRKPGDTARVNGQGPVTGVNDRNEIVGHSNLTNAPFLGIIGDPFVARLGDIVADSTWTFGDPVAINNRGMILVNATRRSDGHPALVVLVPSG